MNKNLLIAALVAAAALTACGKKTEEAPAPMAVPAAAPAAEMPAAAPAAEVPAAAPAAPAAEMPAAAPAAPAEEKK